MMQALFDFFSLGRGTQQRSVKSFHPPGGDGARVDDSEILRDLWYLALPGRGLRRGRVTAKILLGEPLLIGRDKAGAPFALRNICPHRGMPLSYGRFDGCEVECSYHGWRFGTDGACTAIPSLVADQHFNVDRVRVQSYPCREVQGNIWVYFGTDTGTLPEVPVVPDVGERQYQIAQSMIFPCDIDHAVVGLMDPAHGPFVHRSWWWRSQHSMHEKQKRFEPAPLGFRMVSHRPSSNSRAYRVLGGAPETEISFQLPGVRIEHVRAGRHVYCSLTAVTPLRPGETEVHHIIYWTMPWLSAFRPIVRLFARAFLKQDGRVVAQQQDGLAYHPTLMFINDADTQAKWYYRLKKAYTESKQQGRPFDNPVPSTVLRWRS